MKKLFSMTSFHVDFRFVNNNVSQSLDVILLIVQLHGGTDDVMVTHGWPGPAGAAGGAVALEVTIRFPL